MYRNQETHTFDPDVSHALVLYEPSNADRPRPQKRHPFLWKGVALVLCCCLLSGGAVWSMTGGGALVIPQGAVVTPVVLNTAASGKAIRDAAIYAAAVNSVVSINTTSQAGVNIFGQPVQAASSGSGFILSSDGYILTSYHVVQDASSVQVTTYGGDTFQAQVIGGDADYDIAVLKVSASGLQRAVLGNSDTLNVGDRVLAIGNPLGELTFSLSGGMVSSVNRAINVSGIPFHMIQTDTSINPGNSGGPLLNSYGEVVGIVSAKYSSTGSSGESVEGLGFAIPINDVSSMIQDIMTNGYVTNRAYLGATIGTLNASMAQQYRYDITEGAFVYSVEEGGPADQAGLQLGDVITAIDGTEITSLDDLTAAKKNYVTGDTSTLTVYRQGETITVELTWGETPAETASTQTEQSSQDNSGQNNGSITNPNDLFDYFFNYR